MAEVTDPALHPDPVPLPWWDMCYEQYKTFMRLPPSTRRILITRDPKYLHHFHPTMYHGGAWMCEGGCGGPNVHHLFLSSFYSLHNYELGFKSTKRCQGCGRWGAHHEPKKLQQRVPWSATCPGHPVNNNTIAYCIRQPCAGCPVHVTSCDHVFTRGHDDP